MDNLNINKLLNRNIIENDIKNKLEYFQKNKNDLLIKRGFYIYGNSGVGKTEFIKKILKDLDYDIILYDSGDIRNKSIIDSIASKNTTDKSIISMFNKKIRKIAIIMDEIDSMNNGDKGGISALIKLIRPKKTKKQKLEEITMNPIICIGNYHIDKKIKELMKVTNVYELKQPTNLQIQTINSILMPELDISILKKLNNLISGDLRKVSSCNNLYNYKKTIFNDDLLDNVLQSKINNDYTKDITKNLLNNFISIEQHNTIMNETDRTIVSLLFHENIVDCFKNNEDKRKSILFYLNSLEHYSFADYIDRVTFQKQIWIFNEISSIMKTIRVNNEYINNYVNKNKKNNINEIRFTKILTKYSTEYNNMLFIQELCNKLQMDKSDLLSFFIDLKNKHDENYIFELLNNYDITKLDINRIFRYIENYNLIDE
jgi:SpoVK/Ycf46/Vps4 family AAA+-type ATPase